MAVITSRASREFVESVKRAVPAPRRMRGGEVEDQPPIELEATEAQSLVVGSGLVVAAENVPVKTREDLINCTLFAQIAAGKNAQDPKDVSQWYDEYFKALTIIGWAQSDTRFEEYEFTSKNAEAHQAIMKVLTVVLGPQAAALVVVKTVLDALQSMNADSPWITLFDRQAKTGRSARFQVATAQLDPGGLLQIALVGFDLKTKASMTQVLFFKWKASSTKLKYAAGKATIFEAALAEQRDEIANWLREFRADFVRQVMLPKASTKARSTRKPGTQSMKQPRRSKRGGRKRGSKASRGRKTTSAPRRRALKPPSGPLHERILALQRRLGVPADGIVGPLLLSRIEDLIESATPRTRPGPTEAADAPATSLTVSTRGLEAIVRFEVGSEATYERKYRRPIWPGGESGVTAGIGYDLGMNADAAIRDDWRGQVSDADLELLASVARIVGAAAKAALARVKSVDVPLWAARQVFAVRTLPRYAQATRRVFPGVQDLPADAQSALLSLVFNRGASLTGKRREEMRAIRDLVPRRDLAGIAGQLRAMTRLWEGMGLPGLIQRRRDEADLVEQSARTYSTEELVRI